MSGRRLSAESLYLPEDLGHFPLAGTDKINTPRHNYNTRLSARQGSSWSLTGNSDKLPTRSNTRARRICEQDLVLFDRPVPPQNMDWRGDRVCRASAPYNLSKCAGKFLIAGLLAVAVAFLNQKIREALNSYNQVQTDIGDIQEELKAIQNQLSRALKGAGGDPRGMRSGGGSKPDSQEGKIENVVKRSLQQYDADKTGKTDYALESAGGSIVTIRNTKNYHEDSKFSLFGFTICEPLNGPRSIIQAGCLPGECWAIKGQSGTAVIKLLGKVIISEISLEHIPKALSPTGEIGTAPKEFSIWGLNSPTEPEGHFFGQFTYKEDGPSVQTFEVDNGDKAYQYIEFKVHSNHGNPEYTCVYRLRVHGALEHSRKAGKG